MKPVQIRLDPTLDCIPIDPASVRRPSSVRPGLQMNIYWLLYTFFGLMLGTFVLLGILNWVCSIICQK